MFLFTCGNIKKVLFFMFFLNLNATVDYFDNLSSESYLLKRASYRPIDYLKVSRSR